MGHPKILNINSNKTPKTYSLKLLFSTKISNPAELKKSLTNNIKLIPIINFKWKIKKIIEKRGFWKKIKNFWSNIKKLFSGKRLGKEYEISITEYTKTGKKTSYTKKIKKREIKKVKPRSFRTEPLICRILKCDPISITQIDDPVYISNQYCRPQKYLLRLKKFKESNHFYKAILELSLNDEIIDFLSDYNYIMFDITYNGDISKPNINYHSLVITKNDWKNINIIQATDLHLAERNDQMLKKINEMYKNKEMKITSKKLIKLTRSLEKRLINPNNLFRIFIKEMNKRVLENKIDFIFITGDIVDFSIISHQSPHQENIFDYEKSNWKIFKDIILYMNSPTYEGIEEYEELLCPIFTILGNHDYRPWQYDLNWGGIYKKVGLKKIEAQALKDEYSASPIKAILKSEKALNGYLTEINASLDYSLKFDKNIFIFLNSGADSFREITDFVRGNPSLTGINKRQIRFIKNIVNYPETNSHQIILSIHGPPINTPLKRGIISRFKKFFNKNVLTRIDQFKESKFKKIDKKKEKARIDNKFNIHYGTFSTNWEELINFCNDYCILTVSGHTHILNEYRLQRINESKNDDSSIAVFYDNYSDTCNNPKKIKKKAPFIVQTPALGFKSYKKPGRVGGFREIKIKNSKLYSFKVKYL